MHLAELPILIVLIYFTMAYVPMWVSKPYEWVLISSAPLLMLLEGASCVLIIQCLGQAVTKWIEKRPIIVSTVTLGSCFAMYMTSFVMLYAVYMNPDLSRLSAR
jgi:hypothetical protein